MSELNNTCKDCKWWDKLSDQVVVEHVPDKTVLEFKLCDNQKFVWGSGFPDGERLALSGVVYSEIMNEDSAAEPKGEIMTGPDFGCIHWEAK